MEENLAVRGNKTGHESGNADAEIHVAAFRKVTGHEVGDAFASE
jgi:hypothetical protein